MRNALLISLVGVFVVSLIILAAIRFLPEQAPPESLSPSSLPEPPAVEQPSNDPYLLRTYDGKLAVFTTDLVTPDLVFDVYVRTLPEQDQQDLERGIRVADYEKLVSLVEDYIS